MKAAQWKNLPIEQCENIHLRPREAVPGADPTTKSTHCRSCGDRQVISIMRGKGAIHMVIWEKGCVCVGGGGGWGWGCGCRGGG